MRTHTLAVMVVVYSMSGCSGQRQPDVGATGGGAGAGTGGGATGGAGGGMPSVDPLAHLPTVWPDPPADSDLTTALADESGIDPAHNVKFTCQRVRHDVQRNFDSILALGDAYADLLPGMVLQGRPFASGIVTSVPLARAPFSLSIGLPVTNPVARVDAAPINSAVIQAAVSKLQREADAELGSLPDLPARLTFKEETVSSFEQASIEVGVDLNYSGPLASAGLKTSFSTNRSKSETTVFAKLYQPMYTISIADDELPSERAFFAGDANVAAAVQSGAIGTDNLPVFVKSVTYGRVVIFSMTSSEVKSSSELKALVHASFSSFSGDASLRTRYESVVSSASIQIMALGGSAAEAATAIQTADYSRFFGPARATTAVPLNFRVQYLKGARPIARIGDALSYTTESCGFQHPIEVIDTRSWNARVTECSGGTRPVATGIDVLPGDDFSFTAVGSIWAGVFATGCNGPAGWGGQANNSAPLPGQSQFALIGKLGNSGWHILGGQRSFPNVSWTGSLELGTNDDIPCNGDNCGPAGMPGFQVTISRTRKTMGWE